jgi:hypothetical protein
MKRAVIFAIVAAYALAAQSPTPVPVDKEPRHHLILQNDKVKVYDVVVAPHDQTLLHQHDHDYVFVTLGDSDIENRVLGKPPIELKLKDGETKFSKGPFAHVAANLAGTPFHNITIEILPTEPTGLQAAAGLVTKDASMELLFDEPVLRGYSYTLPPGAWLLLEEHDHLIVPLTDGVLRNAMGWKDVSDLRQKRGQPTFFERAYAHKLTNVGSAPIKFVAIELK